jgi:hypothetical protein
MVIGYLVFEEATGGSGYLLFFDWAAAGRVPIIKRVAVKRTEQFIVCYFTVINEGKGKEVW